MQIVVAKWNKKGELSIKIKPNKNRYLFRNEHGTIPIKFKDKRPETHTDEQRLIEIVERLKAVSESLDFFKYKITGKL